MLIVLNNAKLLKIYVESSVRYFCEKITVMLVVTKSKKQEESPYHIRQQILLQTISMHKEINKIRLLLI